MTARKLPLLLLLLIAPLSSLARSQITKEDIRDINSRSRAIREVEEFPRSEPPKKPKLSKEAEAALAPPDDLKLAYKDFLKQKNTGLIRLLPRKEKKEGMIVSAENPTAYIPFRDGGSSYSFSNRKYADDFVAPELGLEINTYLFNNYSPGNAFLMTTNIGFITKLGDVALEDVTLDRKEARFLFDFKAPNTVAAAQEYNRMSSSDFEMNGVLYRWCAPAENNTTYLARTIQYGSADLLVAFRTVREEPDGSFVILWKILKKNPITFLRK
jgi:hypothetical protein